MKKIIAVASIGGHWIQLQRIAKGLESRYDVVYCSTHEKCATQVPGHRFIKTGDFSRWDIYRLPRVFFQLVRVMRAERPAAVITTGAAPGLTALLAARMAGGIKTVWIDSVANAAHLSACGRVALHIADRVYTQWENLADGRKIWYAGSIFG